MARTCFISYKAEDQYYKDNIQHVMKIDMIDRSLNEPIDSDNEDYIMRKIRDDYLSTSTVTIHLIGEHGAQNRGWEEQRFIKRELQASLYNGQGNTRNGVLGIVLPKMFNKIYHGTYTCSRCGNIHNSVKINDSTVVSEFSHNYYIGGKKCAYPPEDRYCILVPWEDFQDSPEQYIEEAFEKRSSDIAEKVTVYPDN